MTRNLDEWIGKNDDSTIPSRVKERVARRQNDCCASCTRKCTGGLRAEYDHIIPLILGGEHRESNLQVLCYECHKAKTKLDVKIKAKVSRIRKKEIGIKKTSSNPIPGSRASKYKRKMDGTIVMRD